MEKNQEKLLQELKKRIAISNFETENLEENQKVFPTNFLEDWRKSFMNKKILRVAGTLVAVIALFGVSTGIYAKMQWEIGFKEYQNREYETSIATIKDANESGYTENIDMDYIVQDGIGVKLTALLMTDEHFELTADFDFPEDMEINTDTFCYGFAVYDEDKNVYSVNHGHNAYSSRSTGRFDTYTPYMYDEIGVDYDRFNLYDILLNDVSGTNNILAENHHITSKIELSSSKGFPKSKKLFVRINNLGYTMVDISDNLDEPNYTEDFEISNKEWIFELDVPEKFYNRKNIELTLKDEIPKLTVRKLEISELILTLEGTYEGLAEIEDAAVENPAQANAIAKKNFYITDGDGNIYYYTGAEYRRKDESFGGTFEISKNMLDKKLFLNVAFDGNLYTSELIEK